MLLMVQKGIWGEICHGYVNANKKYMRDYDKNRESSYVKVLEYE